MENLKILARPVAYKMLIDPAESERLTEVVADALSIARQKNGKKYDFAFPVKSEFLIRTRWAENPGEESVILISSSDEANEYNMFDPQQLELAIKEGVQIPFFG